MAVFIDLEEDDDQQSHCQRFGEGPHMLPSKIISNPGAAQAHRLDIDVVLNNGRVDQPEINMLAAAVTCYPIALSLAAHLDLNDLDALAATCRIVHQSLRQYARQLKAQSLRCVHDDNVTAEMLDAPTEASRVEEPVIDISIYTGSTSLRAESQATTLMGPGVNIGIEAYTSPPGLSNKPCACARDLVSACRKCETVVCRNCTIKHPTNAWLGDRFRRLCKTCLHAPFGAHLQPIRTTNDGHDVIHSSASSVTSERSFSFSSCTSGRDSTEEPETTRSVRTSFTSSAFLRGPCTCVTRGIFLCTHCGQNLRAADTTYKRVWTWRSRYSTHIGGGLGTGLGQGDQGQKCGRGEDCLESSPEAVCWVEIDCAEGTTRDHERDHEASRSTHADTPDYKNNKPGYFQQEIEGIGGVVKKKVKKRVKVGATVWEFEDERASGKYLEREAKGLLRSWCGWCGRVCPGQDDMKDPLMDVAAI